jgi:hypothetical protein
MSVTSEFTMLIGRLFHVVIIMGIRIFEIALIGIPCRKIERFFGKLRCQRLRGVAVIESAAQSPKSISGDFVRGSKVVREKREFAWGISFAADLPDQAPTIAGFIGGQ